MIQYSSCIGYGWCLDGYEVAPFLDEDILDYDDWWDDVIDSDYFIPLNGYDNTYFFFGIKMTPYADQSEWIEIGENIPDSCGDWDKCLKEFNKFFASCEKPKLMLLSILW